MEIVQYRNQTVALIYSLCLANGVTMTQKRQLLTLIFACLCFKKSSLINNNNNNNNNDNNNNNNNTTYACRTKAKAKHQGCQQLRYKWDSKALHGKYPQRVKQADVDQDKTHRWLKAAGLKAETEDFIIAAQDQSLPTGWYQHNILNKPDVDPKCKLCGHFDKTIDHLVSGCPELAKTEYIHRHNKAAAHMHW